MTTVRQMRERWDRLNLRSATSDIVTANSEQLAEIQRKQLMAGQDSDGKPLLAYKNDPYFKSAQSADRYSKWKKRLHPETPEGISNMNITGYYHGLIYVKGEGNMIVVENSAPFAASAELKNRGKLLGFNPANCKVIWSTIVRPPLVKHIASETGCGLS